jgi:hypothetical protein
MKFAMSLSLALLLAGSSLVFAGNEANGEKSVPMPPHPSTAAITTTSSINGDAGSLLTVFVDGPSGFVFVYTADGWKFVGDSSNARTK